MRDSSGRRKVVLVAIATTLMLALIGPQVTQAKEPSGLHRFMRAIAHVESGGRYDARNRSSGAYGKYQIMPSNWPAWARTYLGNAKAKPTPANQERVARAKFIGLHRWLDSWRRVAYWWLTGSSRKTGWSATATRYVNRVMAYYKHGVPGHGGSGGAKDPDKGKGGSKGSAIRHLDGSSARIDYDGGWRTARHSAYRGSSVRYATKAGATATLRFSGRSVTWVGPVGPTRGKARVSIDGKVVRTVDLQRGGFRARVGVFTKTWKGKGTHTISIKVVGGGSHPMVAIDEFVIR